MAKIFVAGTRKLKWKNLDLLKGAFTLAQETESDLELDLANLPYRKFMEKVASAYAVILVSLGDISPNLVLDALRARKPVILTRETGLLDRLGDSVIWVNPQDKKEIAEKIVWLANEDNYREVCRRAEQFSFKHSWREIANEFLDLVKTL